MSIQYRLLRQVATTRSVSIRQFGKKSKGKGGGGGGGVSFRFVFSPQQLLQEDDHDPDELIKFPKAPKLRDLQNVLAEDWGIEKEDTKNLECYIGDEWVPLESKLNTLAGKSKVPLRDPKTYTNYSDEEDYGDYMDENYDDEMGESTISIKHGTLVKQLKADGYKPSTDSLPYFEKQDGSKISTKDFIMDVAKDDTDLQDMLVNRIGVLDHLVQALHYPFVWDKQSANLDDDEDSNEKTEA